MNLGYWAYVLTCGCAGSRAYAPAREGSPFGSEWDYRGSESTTSSQAARSDRAYDTFTPAVERARPVYPISDTPPASGSNSLGTSPESRRSLPPAIELPRSLRYSTSRVAMYLRNSVSTVFRPPAID